MREQDLGWQLRERGFLEWTVPDQWRIKKQACFVFEVPPAHITLERDVIVRLRLRWFAEAKVCLHPQHKLDKL